MPATEPHSHHQDQPAAFWPHLPLILLLTFTFLANFLARFIMAPLMPLIEVDLGISHTLAGMMFLLISVGYFVGLLLSGVISSRINYKRTIVLSSFLCAFAVVGISQTDSILGLSLGLILAGLTSGLYLPSGMASITHFMPARHWGKGLSVHEMAPSLGFVIGPLLMEAFIGWQDWRGVLLPIAAMLVGMGVFYGFGKRTGTAGGQSPNLANMREVFKLPAFWLMMIPFCLSVATNVGVFTMLPLYLQFERGMEQSWVNQALSASRALALVTPVIAGWASDRFGRRPALVVILLLSGLSTALLGLGPNHHMGVLLAFQGMLAPCFFPVGFALLSAIVSPEQRSLAISLMMPVAIVVGMGFIPIMVGAFGDAGMFDIGFILVGVLVFLSPLMLLKMGPLR